MTSTKDVKYSCPYCNELLTENELWLHCPRYHGEENKKMICPICKARTGSSVPVGDDTWGYSSHLHYQHGPPQPELEKERKGSKMPTYAFSLVIIQHPVTKKFVLVKECCKQGYWLPAGRVDPGETFHEAAIRETLEEAGIKVKLQGVLKIEYSPYKEGGARHRIIFYAHPADLNNMTLKSIPDFESIGAIWISFDELVQKCKSGEIKLRGPEPSVFFGAISKGCTIHPMSILGTEHDNDYNST